MTEPSTYSESIQAESTVHTYPPVCADCGAPLSGPFCSQCGEHVIDRHSLTLWHFLNHNLLHELSHVDGKVFHTFRCLLFRPGFLSAEYFAGHRRGYINPVRLLLTCLVVLALLPKPGAMTMNVGKLHLSLLPPGPPSTSTIEETVHRLDVFGILTGFMAKEANHKDLKSEASVEKFNHELKTYVTALSFANVILLSGFLAVLYYRRRPLFVEHLVFSLHLACFVVLFSIVPGPLFSAIVWAAHGRALTIAAGIVVFLLISLEMGYLYKALLRFYRPDVADILRWWSTPAWITRLAVIAIFIANSFFITFTYAAGAAIALWRV
jgi:hypothetical protein